MKTLLVLLLLLPSLAHADDVQVWLTSGFWSRHVQEDKYHYRQNNSGIGVQVAIDDTRSVYAGHYINSIKHQSNYIGYAYQPWHPVDGLKIGVIVVAANGYRRDGALVVLPLPAASYQYRSVGVNLIYIPCVVTALQLKIQLF